MSNMSPQQLKCPKCGNEQKIAIWNSINVTLDPDLKQDLLKARINMFKCKKCKYNAFINIPLLYHDMTLKFCVQYYSPEELDDVSFFKKFKPDGSLRALDDLLAKFADSGAYMAKPHVVFDMAEMVRYVIFRGGVASQENKNSEPAPPP